MYQVKATPLVLLLLLSAVGAHTGLAVPDRSQWEWKLSDVYTGTLMMRPSSNSTWGTVCKDGMKGVAIVCGSLGLNAAYVGEEETLSHSFAVADLGFGLGVWTIAPGPSDAPIYLDDATCPPGATHLDNCSWAAGDASVLGAGTPGTDCSHAEDIGFTCSPPTIDAMNYRLLPFDGLPPGAMSGSIEVQMSVDGPWQRVLAAQHILTYDIGIAAYLCGRIFPDKTFTRDQAQVVAPGVGTLSAAALSNSLNAFKIEGFGLSYNRVWKSYPPSTFDSPADSLTITCEAHVEVRLVNGSNGFEGNAEIRLEIPNLYTSSNYTSICGGNQPSLASSVCVSKFGTDYIGNSTSNGYSTYPFGTNVSSWGGYQFSYAQQDSYLLVETVIAATRLSDWTSPSIRDGPRSTPCSNPLPVTCTSISSTRWEYNFTGGSVSSSYVSARVFARRVVEGAVAPLELWSPVCVSGWSAETKERYCRAMGLYYNTFPGIVSLAASELVSICPNCSVSSFDNCESTSSVCTSSSNAINCWFNDLVYAEFKTPSTFSFRLADNVTDDSATYIEGVVEMQGNSTAPWRSLCMATTAPSYIAAFASSMCRELYPNRSFYGEQIDLPRGAGGMDSNGFGVTQCIYSSLVRPHYGITQLCTFKGATSCAPIAIRCNFSSPSFRLFDADATGRSGILQMQLPGMVWGRVHSVVDSGEYSTTYAASIMCEEIGFKGAIGYVTYNSTRNDTLGVAVSRFEVSYGSRLSPNARWNDLSYQYLYTPSYLTATGYTRLTCLEPYNQSLMEMQLIGGSNSTNGVIEARLDSTMPWGRVCSETSSDVAGKAACRYLFGDRYYATTTVSPLISTVRSSGNQFNQFKCYDASNNLTTCSGLPTTAGDPSGSGTCTGISVQCLIADTRTVRLVDGSAPSNGMLQLYAPSGSGEWTTVCNEHFKTDNRIWAAMCTLAGYPPTNTTAPRPRYQLLPMASWSLLPITAIVTPPSSSPACQDALLSGDAANISLSCLPWETSSSACLHQEDVGLDCMPTTTPSISLSPITKSKVVTRTISASTSSSRPSTESNSHVSTLSQISTPSSTLVVPPIAITRSRTSLVYCVNSSWPPVGMACEMLVSGCTSLSSPSAIDFSSWYGGDKMNSYELVLAHHLPVREDMLAGITTTSQYRKLKPEAVVVESTTSSNVTAAVYVKTQPSNATSNGLTLRIEMRRLLGPSDPSTGTVASVGIFLGDTAESGPFACVLPNNGLPADQKPTAMRLQGLYLPLLSLLFDAPPPLADPGTRKAVAVAANAAAVASMAAGPIAADMQALAALGSMRCAPGGGDATGQNEDAVDDNMGALSIVALDNTCQGVLLGNFIVLGACAVLNTVAAVSVFVVKRLRGHPHFPFMQAMALVRLPSLLFVGASALQMGFVVCGYQLMSGGGGGGDAALGAIGFVVAVVLLPVVPAVISSTVMSRQRYCVDFPSFTLSAPSRRPKEPIAELPITANPKPSWVRSKLVSIFLPSSTLDTDFHPLSVAFSTFASRNRLPHAVWSSLPYITPLALLPPLLSPIQACLPLLIVSSILHLILAAVMLVFRPHAILFSNLMGAAALLVNALLVICAAALTHDPGMELARTVLNSIGGLQMMVSVVRLLHVAVVSVALPAAMALHMLRRPVRVSPPPATAAVKMEDDDVELLDIDADTPTPKVVEPLWTVHTACAPQWPPTRGLNGLGVGNNFIQDLLFAPDMNGPRPDLHNPADDTPPRSLSVSAMEEEDYDDYDLLPPDLVLEEDQTPPTVTPPVSLPPSSESDGDSSDEVSRLKQLRDPSLNPMALMDSTAKVLSQRSADAKKKKRRRQRLTTNKDPQTKKKTKSLYYFANSSDDTSSSTLLDDEGEPLPRRKGSPRRMW